MTKEVDEVSQNIADTGAIISIPNLRREKELCVL